MQEGKIGDNDAGHLPAYQIYLPNKSKTAFYEISQQGKAALLTYHETAGRFIVVHLLISITV
jgi:hypothetical protein